MADLNAGTVGSITTADNYILPYDGGGSGSIIIHFDATSYVGSGAVLKARVHPEAPWLPIPYSRLNVAGSASDGAVSSSAIAADGIIEVVLADGLQVALDASGGGAYTSGTLAFWSRKSALAA